MTVNVQVSDKKCSISNCEKEKHAKTLCHNHYRELRRRQAGAKPQAKRPDICIAEGCDKKHYCMNYCSPHYYRLLVSGNIKSDIPIRVLTYGKDDCDIVFCKNKHKARGLCGTHDATKRTYNLTSEKLVEMLSQPCEVCGTTDSLTIDHDHSCCNKRSSCGKCVRGTVCQNCNRAMGQAKDNPQTLRMLADYLDRYSKSSLL
jgi:hypothetical protein